MNLARTLVISWDVLMGHKLRTLLSSTGIAIGVAAVVIMVGAGKAAEEEVVGKVRSMGTNLLVVQAGRFQNLGGRTRQVATFTTLTQRDVQALSRRITGIERIAGVYQRSAVVRYKGIRTRTDVAGAEPALFQIRGISAASGRLFTDLEQRSLARVAVVGPTVASNVFSGADPVGRSVEINKILFKVVGVTSPRGQDLSGDDQDDVVYVPLSTAMVRVFHVTYLQGILIQAESAEAMASLPDQIAPVLRKTHRLKPGKENDFTIQDQAQLMRSEQDTSQAFTVLVGSVAGVSLFTGGVGILAVMLISIRERTREIGLRRALGGRRRDILGQFLLEAGSLAAMGGLSGVLVGLGDTWLTVHLMRWPLVWPWSATAFALGLSVTMGVAFGLYPAMKAARLEPAVALHAAG